MVILMWNGSFFFFFFFTSVLSLRKKQEFIKKNSLQSIHVVVDTVSVDKTFSVATVSTD